MPASIGRRLGARIGAEGRGSDQGQDEGKGGGKESSGSQPAKGQPGEGKGRGSQAGKLRWCDEARLPDRDLQLACQIRDLQLACQT